MAGRAAFEARLLRAASRDPARCLPSLLPLLLGASYLFVPIDLIPDRLPWIGHLDELGFLLAGLLGARRLLPREVLDGAAFGIAPSVPPSVPRGAAPGALRTLALGGLFAGAGPALHRLSLGVWPDREATRRMAAGFRDARTPLPPLMRGLAELPAARAQLSRVLLFELMRSGALPRPPDRGGRAQIAPNAGDPLAFWDGPPLAFLHVEKTAGIALAARLTERFHPMQIDHDPDRAAPPHLRSPFPPHVAARARRRALLWGHYDLPGLRRCDPHRPVLTVLRDPAARLVSLYDFWRSVEPALVDPAGGNFQIAMMRDRTLAGFLASPEPVLRNYLDNVYVRRLTGLYVPDDGAPDPLDADPEAALARALAALASIEMVGVTERMPDTLRMFRHATGADLGPTLPVVNALNALPRDAVPAPESASASASAATSASRTAPTPTPPPLVDRTYRPVARTAVGEGDRALLDRLTRLDRVLYRHACRRLDRHAEAA